MFEFLEGIHPLIFLIGGPIVIVALIFIADWVIDQYQSIVYKTPPDTFLTVADEVKEREWRSFSES